MLNLVSYAKLIYGLEGIYYDIFYEPSISFPELKSFSTAGIVLKTEPITLHFYTKPDCELCDKAKIVIERIKTKLSYISIEEIDITKNMGLFTKYKENIPVIEIDNKILCQHNINERRLLWSLRWNQLLKVLNRS